MTGRHLLVGLLLSLLLFALPERQLLAAEAPDPTSGCAGVWQPSGGNRGQLTIDCIPGFVSSHDRIYVYPRTAGAPTLDWRERLDMSNALWIFDVGATAKASLIIDFHRHTGASGVVADLYDDQDGDGKVAFSVQNGLPVPSETKYPTVQVSAPDGWWVRDGVINFNLDIAVNGPVLASLNAELYNQALRTDSVVDYLLRVRDDDHDGRPDWQLNFAYPPVPKTSGVMRSVLMANTKGEDPVTGYLFWPILGVHNYGIVKDYNTSYPPIQLDWSAAKITFIGEFVASHSGGSNWYVQSIAPFGQENSSYGNFENPFAFYDLARKGDGYPDLAIRQEYYGPADPFFSKGKFDQPSQLIRYSWDQDHNHVWDYKIDLLGKNPLDRTVRLGAVLVNTVPYAEFPSWVASRRWDIAGFVAAEPGAWTSEGIYQSTFNALTVWARYLTGVITELPQMSTDDLPPGYRGEFTPALLGQPSVYFSPIDRKLHLLKAQTGAWNLGSGREIRYANLGGDYLNRWSVVQDGAETQSLTYVGGQLILADSLDVRIKGLSESPALFTAQPPTDHDQWAQLGSSINEQRRLFAQDDLIAMFEQFQGTAQILRGATVRNIRLRQGGFRMVLELTGSSSVSAPWAEGLEPGAYVVDFDATAGYSAHPLTPVRLELGSVVTIGEQYRALDPLVLSVVVRNLGGEDAKAIPVIFTISKEGGPEIQVESAAIDVPAEESKETRSTWVPPSDGVWAIQASVGGGGGSSKTLRLSVASALASGVSDLLVAQGRSVHVWLAVWLVFVAAVAFAGVFVMAISHHREDRSGTVVRQGADRG